VHAFANETIHSPTENLLSNNFDDNSFFEKKSVEIY